MKVKYSYSKIQFDNAVEFIAKNNKHFIGNHKEVSSTILQMMEDMAGKFPHSTLMATMGFTILADVFSEESMDYEDNSLHLEILVDPALSEDSWDDEDRQESIKIIPRKSPGKNT